MSSACSPPTGTPAPTHPHTHPHTLRKKIKRVATRVFVRTGAAESEGVADGREERDAILRRQLLPDVIRRDLVDVQRDDLHPRLEQALV